MAGYILFFSLLFWLFSQDLLLTSNWKTRKLRLHAKLIAERKTAKQKTHLGFRMHKITGSPKHHLYDTKKFQTIERSRPLKPGKVSLCLDAKENVLWSSQVNLKRAAYSRAFDKLSTGQTDSQVARQVELAYWLALGGQTDRQVSSQVHASRKNPFQGRHFLYFIG